jgi:hypothetical protein
MAKIKNPLNLTIKWKGLLAREVYLDHQVKNNQWTVGAEVGVRFGRTLFHLLDNNPNLKMYAVDKDVSQFVTVDVLKKYGDRLVVLEGDSSQQALLIKEPIDFVFIDAGHSTKSVTKDILAYQPLLKTINGLTGHDIDYPSIQDALKNLKIEYDVCPDNVWHRKG